MNERTKELADQCWDEYPNTGPVVFNKEKFAELIVAECEKVISAGQYSDMACEGNSHRISYNNGRYGAVVDIKKHFGVEL